MKKRYKYIALSAFLIISYFMHIHAYALPLVTLIITALLLNELFKENRKILGHTIYFIEAYVLSALNFAFAYSFLGVDQFGTNDRIGRLSFFDFLYFSFVTISSLGYGDIFPCKPFSQTLAIIESLIGILILAVGISYIISDGKASDN